MSALLQNWAVRSYTDGVNAPARIHNGIPFEADGTLAVAIDASVANYHQGLGFTSLGRLVVTFTNTIDHDSSGSANFDSAGRLCVAPAGVAKVTDGVGYRDGRTVLGPIVTLPPLLSAPLLSTILSEGTGSLTVPAIGDADYERLSLDNEGIWRPVLAEELRQKGQRRVENLLLFSEDFSTSSWSKSGDSSVTGTNTLNYPSESTEISQTHNVAIASGETRVGTFLLSGSGTITIRIVAPSGSYEQNFKKVTLTSTPQIFTIAFTATSAHTSSYIGLLRNVGDTATEVTAGYFQLEDSTGRDDVTTPSEYVSTGVGTGSELFDNPTIGAWTDNGGGSYSLTGDGSYQPLMSDQSNSNGQTFVAIFTVDSISGGSLKFFSGNGQQTVSSAGDYTLVIQSQADNQLGFARAAADTITVTISNISIKQIDHGANVDGVIYSPYENGNVVNSNVVTEAQGDLIAITPPEYVELSGNSGSYISTPDSAAASITGDIEFILYMSMDDWTPSAGSQVPISKWSGTGNLSYAVQIAAGGTINLFLSSDGSATVAGGSIATGFADGTAHWLRVTWSDSGDVVNFYTSDNDKDTKPTGDEWTQLGAADVPLVSAGIFDANAPVTLSGISNGGSQLLAGKIYQAQIYNGIDGTLAVSFNAADGNWQTPKTLTSSITGEVYTLNGDAYLSTATSPVNYYAPLGLMEQGTATELSGFSNDLANWPTVTSAAVARDAVGLTGQPNSAETLTDSSAVANEYRQRNFTVIDDSLKTIGVIWTPYVASPAHYPMFSVGLASGTGLQESIVFDPSDGNYVERIADGDVISVQRIGDMWRIEISVTNNSSGNVTGYTLAYPAWNTTLSSSSDVTTEGSTVVASFELYKTTPSYQPLLTTGGTTKTVADDTGATLDLVNFNDSEGSMQFVLTPEFLTGASASEGVATPNANAAKFLRWNANSSSQLNINDGTTNTNLSSAWSTAGQSITIKFRWGNGTMRASVDSVLSASVAYDGSFDPAGAITIFKSLTLAAEMKDMYIWDKDLGNEYLTF